LLVSHLPFIDDGSGSHTYGACRVAFPRVILAALIKKLLKLLFGLIVLAAIALTVFWFARPADVSFDEVRASVPNSAYSHFADIDGVRVHYQEKVETFRTLGG
jgi:hypothetical protein